MSFCILKKIRTIKFEYIKNKYSDLENFELYYEKGLIELNEYGLNFINICFE